MVKKLINGKSKARLQISDFFEYIESFQKESFEQVSIEPLTRYPNKEKQ